MIESGEWTRRALIAGASSLPIFANGVRAAVRPDTSPKIFAHYMVCCPKAGTSATSSDFLDEIRTARTNLIDGFALKCGAWSKQELYPRLTAAMFAAASDANNDFKLFFSADTTGGLTASDIYNMVVSYYRHPCYLRVEGKPLLSSYSGREDILRDALQRLSADGYPVFCVPYLNYGREPTLESVSQISSRSSWADGYFYFGAAGTGDAIAGINRAFAAEWDGLRKPYMASVTPFYRGLTQNFRVFETNGFEGMAEEWLAAIQSGATWIELVTWNDWGECTYVAPLEQGRATDLWNGHWGSLLPHQGYLQASRYFMEWFKLGRPPLIENDMLYYFYRLHPAGTQERIGEYLQELTASIPRGADALEDSVFVTTLLREPAELIISSGGVSHKLSVNRGMQHSRVPFSLGQQHFLLRRGKVIIDHIGEIPIANDLRSNFNYFSGMASARAS